MSGDRHLPYLLAVTLNSVQQAIQGLAEEFLYRVG
jgi:hypothetical protein